MEEKKRELLTSPAGFKDFFKSVVWIDIKNDLEGMREFARDGMEDTDDDEERRACAYRARTIREMIMRIEGLGETAEEDRKEIDSEEDEEPSNEIDYTLGGENG